jgi:hypothetical protein
LVGCQAILAQGLVLVCGLLQQFWVNNPRVNNPNLKICKQHNRVVIHNTNAQNAQHVEENPLIERSGTVMGRSYTVNGQL